jgi:cysteine desulfurase family protein (TIGR01976 family)
LLARYAECEESRPAFVSCAKKYESIGLASPGAAVERVVVANTNPGFDIHRLRSHFPALVGGAAHFDGPGGSQTPDVVADAVRDTLGAPLANRGTGTGAERNAESAVRAAREAIADLLGADVRGVIFGRSMTALTFDLARTMAKDWGEGDEIIVTRLDHDANVRPWVIAAERVGATVRWADFDPSTGELQPETFVPLLSERTRLVAVTAASNLIGTRPDLPAIARLVHAAGAWFYVDGVHFTAHAPVDVGSIGADFYACSPYKFLGPHCGVVVGRPELLHDLHPDKLLPATDVIPERFELGTLPYELLAGTTAAINFLANVVPGSGSRREQLLHSIGAIEEYEDGLRVLIEAGLAEFPEVIVYSRAARRTPTLLVDFAGHDPHRIYRFLGERGVNAPAGSFYAYEASRRLGLGEAGALRVGLAPYNDDDDVARLLDGLRAYFSTAS